MLNPIITEASSYGEHKLFYSLSQHYEQTIRNLHSFKNSFGSHPGISSEVQKIIEVSISFPHGKVFLSDIYLQRSYRFAILFLQKNMLNSENMDNLRQCLCLD